MVACVCGYKFKTLSIYLTNYQINVGIMIA